MFRAFRGPNLDPKRPPGVYRLFLWLWLLLAILAGLGWGVNRARQQFLTRGIPADLPQPIPHAGVAWGVNVYLERYSTEAERDQALAAIAAAGISYIKQSFAYRPAFDWEQADSWFQAAARHSLSLIPLLDGDPATNYAPPADLAAFAAWAGAFAARYQTATDFYIIWDEPNLASHWGGRQVNPLDYAALLTAAATAIRAADPHAFIVLAPLAPTAETNTLHLADPLYLSSLYEAGAAEAFDIVAAKPYGFNDHPLERAVSLERLNFNRAILLREVMERHGDPYTPIWAGNWGWNALPADWAGAPSIWGNVDRTTQAAWTIEAFNRARQEWPWMGIMFLENWAPAAPPDDPRWGFALADQPVAEAIRAWSRRPEVAYPGFHLASDHAPAQTYTGGWEFSPTFGADSSQIPPGAPRDRVTFRFWGTDLGLRVRRADFRARFYVTVDGWPANALPHDEYGTMLVLDAPDPQEDYIAIHSVARNLPPGEHLAVIEAERGWDQWALHGFSVGYAPPDAAYRVRARALGATAGVSLALAGRHIRQTGGWPGQPRWAARFQRWSDRQQWLFILALGALTAVVGWLTWGQQAAGLYRRLGDHSQLGLTLAAASLFYVAPSFFVYLPALLLLVGLIALRPAWGLALIALTFPFYAQPGILKPVAGYRFSAVEIFTLATLAATLLRYGANWLRRVGREAGKTWQTRQAAKGQDGVLPPAEGRVKGRWQEADWAVIGLTLVATLSLFFAARQDVALREWRTVIVEPALFYLLLRWLRPRPAEMARIIDAFLLGALAVALVGLVQFALGVNLITAEGGLLRLRSVYGSPNNVALYLGRALPFALTLALLGGARPGRRRWLYALAAVPMLLAFLLTFSKGGLLLGLPAALVVIGLAWLRQHGRRVWPWALGALATLALAVPAVTQLPGLAGRFQLGETGLVRLFLWRASLEMIREQPLTGVGLDNFLYAYRGRYIFNAAWREPNLNHPHNLFLDFATRLGLPGLVIGLALVIILWRRSYRLARDAPPDWQPTAVGLCAGVAYLLAHGLVDHSFFLVDLAFTFYWLLGLGLWLETHAATSPDQTGV